ncbi:MAG: biotin/lipoyl-containing protein [Candidatus Cloacimonadia bacterium]
MKTYKMQINGKKFEGRVIEYTGTEAKVEINGIVYNVKMEPEFRSIPEKFEQPKRVLTMPPTLSGKLSDMLNPGKVKAPLPGFIVDLPVKEGDKVNAGDVVVILEAMKMESEIAAPVSGIVNKINVKKGESVAEDQILVEISEE